jgi:hypothetical protein
MTRLVSCSSLLLMIGCGTTGERRESDDASPAVAATAGVAPPKAERKESASVPPSTVVPEPAASEARAVARVAASPGPHEVLGGRIEIELAIDQPDIMVSEPVHVRALVHNHSDVPIVMQAQWMGRNRLGRPDNYEIEAVDPTGNVVPLPDAGPGFGGNSWDVTLTREEGFETHLFLPSWAPFSSPGTYALRLTTTLSLRKPDTPRDEAISLPVTTTTSLVVVPDDPVRTLALIERTAKTVSDTDDARRSLRTLGAIRDPRVVPHLVALLRSDEYTRRYEATRVLGTWNDDRALLALKGAIDTGADDLSPSSYTTDALRAQSAAQLRLAVAQALGQSPHPDALELLLSMEGDPEASVRLTVVQKLATLDPSIAKPRLQPFLEDPSSLVVRETTRLLNDL